MTARAGGTRPKLHSDRSANFEICCARRTTEIAGYKAVVDPDAVPKSISTPEDHPETDEAACQEVSGSLRLAHTNPLPEPGV